MVENKCSRNSFAQWGHLINCLWIKCINMTTHNCLLLHSFFNFFSIFSPFNITSILRLYISYLYILPPLFFKTISLLLNPWKIKGNKINSMFIRNCWGMGEDDVMLFCAMYNSLFLIIILYVFFVKYTYLYCLTCLWY